MTPRTSRNRAAEFRQGGADLRAGGGVVLRPPVRNRAVGKGDVSRRHDRAAQEADGGTLAVVVNGLGNLEAVLPAASALAKRHVSYGAKPAHYPVVGGALLWTLEKGLGDAWTPETAAAWTAAYGTLSGYMISEAYGSAQPAG